MNGRPAGFPRSGATWIGAYADLGEVLVLAGKHHEAAVALQESCQSSGSQFAGSRLSPIEEVSVPRRSGDREDAPGAFKALKYMLATLSELQT